jgi:hypothetical protein
VQGRQSKYARKLAAQGRKSPVMTDLDTLRARQTDPGRFTEPNLPMPGGITGRRRTTAGVVRPRSER